MPRLRQFPATQVPIAVRPNEQNKAQMLQAIKATPLAE